MTRFQGRNILVAIGISDYDNQLETLKGAVEAAKAMAAWGRSQQYEVSLITDNCVDIEINVSHLSKILQEIVESPAEHGREDDRISRLVIYFAGHGQSHPGGDSQFWLLKGITRGDPTEAINVSLLGRELSKWGIPQVCFIGDACRTFELRRELVGHGLVYSSEKSKSYHQDKFLAAQVDSKTYCTLVGDSGFCIFTEFLVAALNGDEIEAIAFENQSNAPAVTSQTIATFLEDILPSRALDKYNLEIYPEAHSGFRDPNNVYLSTQHSLPNRTRTNNDTSTIENGYTEKDMVNAITDESTYQDYLDNNIISVNQFIHKLPLTNKTSRRYIPFVSLTAFSKIATHKKESELIAISANEAKCLVGKYFSRSQQKAPIFIEIGRDKWQSVPQFPTQTALYLSDEMNELHFVRKSILDVYLKLEDIYYLSRYTRLRESISSLTIEIANLRSGKHFVPYRAVLAAHLYDSIGDQDNIRRMALYFAEKRQPVPFEIAVLAASEIRWNDGTTQPEIYADFDAVPESEKSSHSVHDFESVAMNAKSNVPVSGFIPIYRKGWAVLAGSHNLDIPDIYKELYKEVRGYYTTTLTDKGMMEFADAFGYEIKDI